MLKKYFLLPFVFTFFISCNQSAVLDKFYKLPENNRWLKSDVKTFEFSITDESLDYDMILQFSHVYDYQYNSVPLKMTIESPSGDKKVITVDLKIKDSSGKQLAECSGDICDLKQKIFEKTKLSKGNYKISITQEFKGSYLPNVLGIGLIIEKSK